MKNATTQKSTSTSQGSVASKQLSYNEIIEFLDKSWNTKRDTSLACIKQLDKAFHGISQKLHTIAITGTNGKSLSAHFLTKLLQQEGLTVGTFYAPHIMTYNERLSLQNESISNKLFTELGNEVLATAQTLQLTPHALDILTMMALLYFHKNNVDVAILEVGEPIAAHPAAICTPKITAITRVTEHEMAPWAATVEEAIKQMVILAKPGTHVVSADQSKLNLQIMQTITEQQESIWSMPIRKLAPLSYPFEQLHGRCAALAERIAYVYLNTFATEDAVVVSNSLLMKTKGQRGRPTLEAKRQSELNPKKTIDQYWKEVSTTLPGRFQILDKEKPTVLLDNASNIDALKNLLLGIRLQHYQRPLKGLTVILGCNNEHLDTIELLKTLRYFFKKTSGQVFVCPAQPIPGSQDGPSWDAEKISNDLKSMKIKAKAVSSFKEAFDMASKTVDERHGLVVVTGSTSIINEYWCYKGMKKLQ